MRNPCPPSTPRQNELQRRAKAHLALRPRKGDFKQHKCSLGNCVVSNPTPFYFSLLHFLLPLPWSLYLVGELLFRVQPQPHIFLLSLSKPHTIISHTLIPPLLCFFYANSLGFLWGFKPHLIMTYFPPPSLYTTSIPSTLTLLLQTILSFSSFIIIYQSYVYYFASSFYSTFLSLYIIHSFILCM